MGEKIELKAGDVLQLIAEGWYVIESDGQAMTIQAPRDWDWQNGESEPRELVIDTAALAQPTPQDQGSLPDGWLDEADVRAIVRGLCEAAGSIMRWSRSVGITDEQTRLFLANQRPAEPKILAAIGLERVVSYRAPPSVPAEKG